MVGIINNFSLAVVNILVFDEITTLNGRSLLYNPFFKAPPMTLSFVTYTMVSNIPNGEVSFKFRIANPLNESMHETAVTTITVKDNIFSNALIWNNVHFTIPGEHTITFYLSSNNSEFEPTGSTVIVISDNVPKKK
ncbi:MAG: hypothetical protein GX660_22610 [Clostridiaceae bacterium]|nr:hypothetical protein [Clostridiaceae bacterium]